MTRLPNICLHVMADGAPCGSPAVRHHRFCYHHKRQREQRLELDADRARSERNAPYNLPILEDANAIQLSLTQIMRLLAAGQIDHKTASLMLYSLQIATSNLQQTTFEPSSNAVRRPIRVETTALACPERSRRDSRVERKSTSSAARSVTIPSVPSPQLTPHSPRPQTE